jgi:ABC-2 type transport system permease protein
MYALVKKEVRSFLSLLIGYIVISVFLLLVGLFLWVFPFAYNIPEGGYARLDSLFDLAPWVFLFLIPAITMRSFAEERRNGTIELLFTKPLTDTQIILSKYIGGLVLVIFSILPTFIYYFSIRELGNPPGNIDVGGTFGSYIGLLMIGATFVAIGIFCSSLTQNQVVAFIIAVFLCFFIYLGFDLFASFSRWGNFDSFVRGMGIYEHYQSIKRGVVDTRDIIYFLTVIALFVLFTKFILEKRKGSTLPQFFITAGIVILLNFIGSFKFIRFDLTEEKIHTLSPATVDFLQNKTSVKIKDPEKPNQAAKIIKGNIDIKVYLTGDLPADLKYLEKAVKEKLDDMHSYLGNRLKYEFVDPYEEPEDIDLLGNTTEDYMKMKLQDISATTKIKVTELQFEENGTLERKYIFPGATVSFEGKPPLPIQFFIKDIIYKDENQLRALAWGATDQLEYKIIDGIRNAKDQIRPAIAILQGHGEANSDELFSITKSLKMFYTVDQVKINKKVKALDPYQLLLVVQPDSSFSEFDKCMIDQFIMRGGKVGWFIDPMHVYADTLFTKGQTFGLSADLNLDDQLFTYGVRLNKDIVIDKTCAPIDVPGFPGNFVEWPFYPYVYPKTKHPIVRNLNPIKFEYASSIDLVGDTNEVKKTILLTTSKTSVVYKAPVRINYGIIDVEPFGSNNIKPYLNLAVLMEGKFKSVFRNRLPDAITKSKDYTFLETSKPTRMLVVSDGDVIKNYYEDSVYLEQSKEFTKRYLKLELDKYHVNNRDGSPKYIYGNNQFLLNAVDYLMGDESLIELRQRTLTIRKLDDVRMMKEKSYWQFMNIGLPVILIIIFGIIQYFIRKRKYSSIGKEN